MNLKISLFELYIMHKKYIQYIYNKLSDVDVSEMKTLIGVQGLQMFLEEENYLIKWL